MSWPDPKSKIPKFPHVKVKLVGEDGNVFSIMGRVQRAMMRAKVPQHEIENFLAECQLGDYDHAIQTVLYYVSTE